MRGNMATSTCVLGVVLMAAVILRITTADIATSLDDVTLAIDSSTHASNVASSSTPKDQVDFALSSETDNETSTEESPTTEATSATTSVRRVRQVLTSEEMTRMRPPPLLPPYPFWNPPPPNAKLILLHHQRPNQLNSRSPQTLSFPPAQRTVNFRPPPPIIQPQPLNVETGFNPTLFTSFNVFNGAFDPTRQRVQEFQGQFGSLSPAAINQAVQQASSPVQSVIGFPSGQRLPNFQDPNNVVQVVQGPNNNGQRIPNNDQIPDSEQLDQSTEPTEQNTQSLSGRGISGGPIHPTDRTNDQTPSASTHRGIPQQILSNEVQDFSALLNTAPHLQAAFTGGDSSPENSGPKLSPRKKATLKEILAEDCPRANDMGYCPSPPRYPAHQVGVITRQCEQLMSMLYAPHPIQDTIISTTRRSIIAASNNASDMERGNRQIWSWARYGKDKGHLDAEESTMCSSEHREMEPGYARDMSTGRWFVVVQANNHYSQRVMVDRCLNEGKPCSGLKGAHCTGFRTRFKQSECVQRYSYVSLITWDPDLPQQCPKMRLFKFPTACVCQLN